MPDKKYKILIVEDDQFLAGMYATKLGHEGFLVGSVHNGEEAMPSLEREQPDLVLLDLLLPGKDGFAILEEIRRHPKFKSLPVIVLSNLGEKENIDRSMKLGANDYLVKAHFLPSEVVQKIRKYLK